MHPAVVEKDFWVCFVLAKLFSDAYLKDRIVFKGGTSLSKVHGIIERFSEDIDLVLDWRVLGYEAQLKDAYPTFKSKTQQDKFNKAVNAKAAEFIGGELLAHLTNLLAGCNVLCTLNQDDPHIIAVLYPAAFSQDYLRPEIWLEIGPLASFVPSAIRPIRPYSAESFPHLFTNPTCDVVAIDAERTFWEKATILHQQAHRVSVLPRGYARHYYDMYKLAHSPVKSSALSNLKLLADVVTFKQCFYPSGPANYHLAKPGTLRLVPKPEQLAELKKDYRQMTVMIFGEIPEFDGIIATLTALEAEANALT